MNSTETKTELPIKQNLSPIELVLNSVTIENMRLQARVEELGKENNTLRTRLEAVEKELDKWSKIAAMVPRKPIAITWEQGVEILNALQNTVEATAEAMKGEG